MFKELNAAIERCMWCFHATVVLAALILVVFVGALVGDYVAEKQQINHQQELVRIHKLTTGGN